VHLEGTSPAGYQAGFVIGNGGLLDVSVLNNLKLTTYLGNQPQESASGTDLLRLTALPDNSGRYQVSFAGSMPFDRVEIQRTAALSVLDNLRLYYGFGIEPKAFRDLTPVLSDNPTAQAGTNYQTESNSLICVGCTIQNPERAADALIADSDYARIISTVGALGTQKLKIKLNGTGLAGNTAGIVLNNGGNLLSSSVLQNIRISTYSGASGDTYVESVTGSALIQSQILSGNRQEISFPTTRDFEWIELEIPNGVSLLNDVHVFYGFAEDRPFSFPSQVVPPILLPVELVQLTAVETTAGVLVRWSTASEKQSQHFVVERAVAAGTAATSFQRLGEVAAAGNTTQAHSYSFLDANVAPLTAPILYYRLRVVNEDGGENLSPVVVVKHQVGRGITLTVSPNPAAASEEVQLQVASPALENAVLHIYNTQGKLVRRLVNNARQRLQLQGLPAGLYHVVLLANSGQRLASQKLIIREP
jgi:hypothetical protein